MESNKPFGQVQNRNVNYFLTCNFIFSIRVPAVLLVQYWCVFCLCPKLQRFLWWFFPTCLPASTTGILRKCTHIWLQEYCHSWGNIRQLKNKLENSRTNIQEGKKLKTMNESSTWIPLIIFLSLFIHLEFPHEEKTFLRLEKFWLKKTHTGRVVGTHSKNIKLFSLNLILTFSCMSTHHAITPIQIRKRRKVADLEDFRKITGTFSQALIELWKRKTWGLFTQRLS